MPLHITLGECDSDHADEVLGGLLKSRVSVRRCTGDTPGVAWAGCFSDAGRSVASWSARVQETLRQRGDGELIELRLQSCEQRHRFLPAL